MATLSEQLTTELRKVCTSNENLLVEFRHLSAKVDELGRGREINAIRIQAIELKCTERQEQVNDVAKLLVDVEEIKQTQNDQMSDSRLEKYKMGVVYALISGSVGVFVTLFVSFIINLKF